MTPAYKVLYDYAMLLINDNIQARIGCMALGYEESEIYRCPNRRKYLLLPALIIIPLRWVRVLL